MSTDVSLIRTDVDVCGVSDVEDMEYGKHVPFLRWEMHVDLVGDVCGVSDGCGRYGIRKARAFTKMVNACRSHTGCLWSLGWMWKMEYGKHVPFLRWEMHVDLTKDVCGVSDGCGRYGVQTMHIDLMSGTHFPLSAEQMWMYVVCGGCGLQQQI